MFKYCFNKLKSESSTDMSSAIGDFQQCDILTSVDTDKPVQPPQASKLQMMFSQ